MAKQLKKVTVYEIFDKDDSVHYGFWPTARSALKEQRGLIKEQGVSPLVYTVDAVFELARYLKKARELYSACRLLVQLMEAEDLKIPPVVNAVLDENRDLPNEVRF